MLTRLIQWSIANRVSVLLPDYVSPVVSRELLYTAVTRARRGVAIHGAEPIIRAAIQTPVQRASGLTDLLQGRG